MIKIEHRTDISDNDRLHCRLGTGEGSCPVERQSQAALSLIKTYSHANEAVSSDRAQRLIVSICCESLDVCEVAGGQPRRRSSGRCGQVAQ